MLNIYTSMNNIPKDKKFINDNEVFFKSLGLYDRKFVEPILEQIEQGSWRNNTTFVDRFGTVLYSDSISTGSKTLINITSSDDVFNSNELGLNAIQYLLMNVSGNVYLKKKSMFNIDYEVDINNIMVDGITPGSVSELEELLCI